MLYVAFVLSNSSSELCLYQGTWINIIKPHKFPLNIFLYGEMRKILFQLSFFSSSPQTQTFQTIPLEAEKKDSTKTK